jgi:hypothetical protein
MLEIISELSLTKIELTNLRSISEKFEINVYPNPTNFSSTVEFTVLTSDLVEIQLYDITGQIVLTKKLGNYSVGERIRHKIDLNNHTSGVYLIKIKNGQWQESKKIILVR